MKKIIKALILAMILATSMNISASAAGIYGWTSPDLGEKFTDGKRIVERAYDDVKGSYVAKITSTNGWNLLRYTIPQDKITSGHTYTVQCYIRTEVGANNWLSINFAGKGDTPYTPQWTSGRTYTRKNVSFDGNRVLSFGLANNGATVIYIDDVVVYDEADPEMTNIIQNGDFETSEPEIQNISFDGKTISWGNPENIDWNMVSIYKKDLKGNETLIADKIVSENTQYEFNEDISLDSSFYLVFKMYSGEKELRSTEYKVVGKADFYDVEIREGTLSAGTFKVVLPVKNNGIEEGIPLELIAAAYSDDELIGLSKTKAIVPKTAENENNYEVSAIMNFTPAENVKLYVFVWDDINTMNVIKECTVIE